MVYEPAPSDVAVREADVPVEVTVTRALGTTAPLASLTVPLLAPVSACPKAAPVAIASRVNRANVKPRTLKQETGRFMMFSPEKRKSCSFFRRSRNKYRRQ